MEPIFLAVGFEGNSLAEQGCDLLDMEEVLEEALTSSKMGEVTGSGSGIDGANLDIDIFEESDFERAIALICETLRTVHAPTNAIITRYEPFKQIFKVYPDLPGKQD